MLNLHLNNIRAESGKAQFLHIYTENVLLLSEKTVYLQLKLEF